MKKRLLALFLTLAMVLALSPNVFALSEAEDTVSQTAKLLPDIENALLELKESVGKTAYEDTDIVSVIIETEEKPLIDLTGGIDIDLFAASDRGISLGKSILAAHELLRGKIKALVSDVSFSGCYDYTTILNGFSAVVEYGDIDSIAAVSGIKSVYVAGTYDIPEYTEGVSEPTNASAADMIGATEANETGYTGKGIVVAVIDTGLQYTHEAFSVSPADPQYTTSDMKSSILSLGDYLNSGTDGKVYSEKVIFSYDYADNDSDVAPEASGLEHGTHVSGTVAGNNGSDFTGIAPDAQLMSMKVFSSKGGGAYDTDIVAALEDAVLLGADVINMSLGSAAGFTESSVESTREMYEKIADVGVILCCAAGNDYNAGYGNTSYDLHFADAPDSGVVGSPSTYGSALSVASVNNAYVTGKYFIVGENKYNYIDNGPDEMKLTKLSGSSYEYVDCGFGNAKDFEGVDVSGKVALIKRGDCTFTEKVANAYAAGAVACIVYNNQDGTISMSVDPYSIPAVSITQADGDVMLKAEDKTVEFTDGINRFEAGDAYTMSDFSSWGCAVDLTLKPEITAVGGNVWSSVPDGYASYSGTSMATPCLAGAFAVYLQYLDEAQPNLDPVARMELAYDVIMSTADVLEDPDFGGYYSPRKQGAGLVNVSDAIEATAYITVDGSRPEAAMGDNADGAFSFTFEITNTGSEAKTYELTEYVATDWPVSDGYDYYGYNGDITLDPSGDYELTYSPGSTVEVAAGETVTVDVALSLTDNTKDFLDNYFKNGTFIEGYILLNDDELSVPFMGFYGDWNTLDIYDEASYYYGCNSEIMFTYKGSKFYYTDFGINYFTNKDSGEKAYNADIVRNMYGIDSDANISSDIGLLRNAYNIIYTVTGEDGTIYYNYAYYYGPDETKSYYYANGGYTTSLFDYGYIYDSDGDGVNDFDATLLPEGIYTYTITSESVFGDVQTLTYDFYVDNTDPVITDAQLSEDKATFTASATDEHAVQGTDLLLVVDDASGNRSVAFSVNEIKSTINSLYSAKIIGDDTRLNLINACDSYALKLTGLENGDTTYDVSGFSELIAAFNEYGLASLLYGEGYTFNEYILVYGAYDYAWNIDGYYALQMKKEPVTVPGSITVYVTNANGFPLLNAYVTLNGGEYTAKTNLYGVVTFKDLPGGEYTVEIYSAPFGYSKKVDAQTVVIDDNGENVTATFTLEKAGIKIFGRGN